MRELNTYAVKLDSWEEYRAAFEQVLAPWKFHFDTTTKTLSFLYKNEEVELIPYWKVIRALLPKINRKEKLDSRKMKFEVLEPGSDNIRWTLLDDPWALPYSAPNVYKNQKGLEDTLISAINIALVFNDRGTPLKVFSAHFPAGAYHRKPEYSETQL